MCGIAGLLHFNGTPVDRSTIEAMTGLLHHRGPDDGGVYLDRFVGLGHRRLSIVDLTGGHQPLSNEDGTIWITYNGEVYNFAELIPHLVASGHRVVTRCDTEVLVHLYEEYEERCLQYIEGMFAFALWDARHDTLFLARDRFGIKPLYYVQTPTAFAFASEIKPLLALPQVATGVDLQAVHDYLTFRYNVAPQTMLTGIRKLEPGHCLVVRHGAVRTRQYWDLDFSKPSDCTEDELIAACRDELRQSVRRHFMGDVPVGLFLSGGLDSTAIAAFAAEDHAQVNSYAVGFVGQEGHDHDELPHARFAARYFGCRHHELALSPQQYADGLERMVWRMEEPVADPSAVPLYELAQLARRSVTVVLSGEGSDELLAGYTFGEVLARYARARRFSRLPAWLRRRVLHPLNATLVRSSRIARLLAIADLPGNRYLYAEPLSMTSIFSEDAKAALWGPAAKDVTLAPSIETLRRAYDAAIPFELLDQMLYVYSKQWLADDLLLKADRMTMAHSLELRVPFLDDRFARFATTVPSHLKIHHDGRRYTGKYLLRKALEGIVPLKLLHRPKQGFAIPIWTFFGSHLKPMALDLIRSASFRQAGLFDAAATERIITHYQDGDRHGWPQSWLLLVFALWWHQFGSRTRRPVTGEGS